MMNYAVVALLSVEGTGTNELTVECETLDDVCARIKELDDHQGWKAITIVHIEDYPRMMEGSEPK